MSLLRSDFNNAKSTSRHLKATEVPDLVVHTVANLNAVSYRGEIYVSLPLVLANNKAYLVHPLSHQKNMIALCKTLKVPTTYANVYVPTRVSLTDLARIISLSDDIYLSSSALNELSKVLNIKLPCINPQASTINKQRVLLFDSTGDLVQFEPTTHTLNKVDLARDIMDNDNFSPYFLRHKLLPRDTRIGELRKLYQTMITWLGYGENLRSKDYNVRHEEYLKACSKVNKLLAMVSTVFWTDISLKKMIFLKGEKGRNGKSSFLRILQTVFENNYTSFNRAMLNADTTTNASSQLAALNGALINICTEQTQTRLVRTDSEMQLCEGDSITVQRKFANDAMPVQTNGMFIDASNFEPKTTNTSDALQARINRFVFPNVFEESQEFDAYIKSETTAQAMLELLIAFCPRTKAQFDEAGRKTEEMRELQVEFQRDNDTYLEYIDQYMIDNLDLAKNIALEEWSKIPVKDIRDGYNVYLVNQGIKPFSPQKLGQYFGRHFNTTSKVVREKDEDGVSKQFRKHICTGADKTITVMARAYCKEFKLLEKKEG